MGIKMAKTYAEKLRDPRWQKKRLEVLANADFHCEKCFDGQSTLNVHHKVYLKDREIWEYDAKQLACLCESCHQDQHEFDQKFKELLSLIPIDGPCDKHDVYFLLAGFLGLNADFRGPNDVTLYILGERASDYWRPSK